MTVNLYRAFLAGFTRRWHSNPHLAHTHDRVDGHSGRVARIILALHPDPDVYLLGAALVHDDGEGATGDIPAPFKRMMPPDMAAYLKDAESNAVADIWESIDLNGLFMTGDDKAWLHFADRLDAYMWAAHHAPRCMASDEWVEDWKRLVGMAEALGVVIQLRAVMAEMQNAA